MVGIHLITMWIFSTLISHRQKLRENYYNKSIDMYSIGCIVYETLTGTEAISKFDLMPMTNWKDFEKRKLKIN